VQCRISNKKSWVNFNDAWIGDYWQDTLPRYCSRCSCDYGVDQWKASKAPSRADVDGQALEFYSFLLACRSFESPGHENDSNGAAEPSSTTRLIEDASLGR
jgi:hypothetical protein